MHDRLLRQIWNRDPSCRRALVIRAAASHDLTVRAARHDDIPALEQLIARSARALSEGFYTVREIEAAIAGVFGVDSDLVKDSTYLMAEDQSGTVLGCGGWSRRRTLFGGDRFAARETGFLDPAEDAARIRAFFIEPDAARRGIARRLLVDCEMQARIAGFTRMTLMATLPGVPFYAAHGYGAGEAIAQSCGGIEVKFVPMSRSLLQ